MVEIEEGLDLDRAVAEAIGLPMCYSIDCVGFFVDPREDTSAVPEEFSPSRDLYDAFKAAEESGLFSNYRVLRKNRYRWEVYEIGESLDRVVSSEDTLVLSICAAILKVKASKQT